jgi:hypothetical protein
MDDERDPRLEDAITRLRDTHPDRDLWPHIARQLEPRRSRGVMVIRWPTALAAGLALALATSLSTAWLVRRGAAPAPAQGTPAIEASAPPSTPATVTMSPSDSALAHAVSEMERAVRGTLAQLDPEARATVTKTLAMLDQAIAQAEAHQSAAPDDPRAARFLTSTLRKKLQLLRTVSGLTQQQT